MKIGEVVIGANYGDEGKGLITDYLASREPESTLVVRFNGGAQAGHTVVTPDGRRHVFSHFGSGSFLNCPTYLSQFFIVNPLLFVKEKQVLQGLGVRPVVSIDHMSMVTTPYDMFINQTLELKRAGARHGSCGVGINETVTRCLRADQFALHACELLNLKGLLEKLLKLGKSWFPQRLHEVGVSFHAPEVIGFLEKHEEIMARFVDDVSKLLHTAMIRQDLPIEKRIIFEGAQGLMLDQDRLDQWPHVTRSRTGLFNALHLARRFQLDVLDVNYVSRTYLTRHGAGPLPGQSNKWFSDRTNIPNQFQGELRFAPMDWKQLSDSIELDLRQARSAGLKINARLAMTCLDQEPMPRSVDLVLPIKYTSSGACREQVTNCALACV